LAHDVLKVADAAGKSSMVNELRLMSGPPLIQPQPDSAVEEPGVRVVVVAPEVTKPPLFLVCTASSRYYIQWA